MFWGRTWETFNGMEEIQTGSMKGYDSSIFRAYAPGKSGPILHIHDLQQKRVHWLIYNRLSNAIDVASFLHDKAVPNSVTVCTGKISHTGTSSNMPEFEYMKTLLPESEWKNIKLTVGLRIH